MVVDGFTVQRSTTVCTGVFLSVQYNSKVILNCSKGGTAQDRDAEGDGMERWVFPSPAMHVTAGLHCCEN